MGPWRTRPGGAPSEWPVLLFGCCPYLPSTELVLDKERSLLGFAWMPASGLSLTGLSLTIPRSLAPSLLDLCH